MDRYKVKGMHCAVCQARVEKAVRQVPGVESCAVSLLTNSMGVEGTASPKDIMKAVKDAGYGISPEKNGAETGRTPGEESGGFFDAEIGMLKKRLLLSAFFLFCIMYLSMGVTMLRFPLPGGLEKKYIVLTVCQMVLSLIVMVIGRQFFISGFRGVIHGAPNMDTLVSMGSAVSWLWSVSVFVRMLMVRYGTGPDIAAEKTKRLHHLYHRELYFESAAMILAFITIGKLLEAISKGRTTGALRSLMQLAPEKARILRDGEETEVPVSEVKPGDVFVVRPGDRVPVDGTVLSGSSAVDESFLTGESIPVDKTEGNPVYAASINRSGLMTCRADRVGEDTSLSQIIKMVSDAAATKAPLQRIADRVSGVFVPIIIFLAVLVTGGWLLAGRTAAFAVARGISVLVIACPCALGLATPVAIMVGSGVAAKNGILFKTGESMETLGRVKTVLMDKTGTITAGKPEVTEGLYRDASGDMLQFSAEAIGGRDGIAGLRGMEGQDSEKVREANVYFSGFMNKLRALERGSAHPLAEAVVRFAEKALSEEKEGNRPEAETGNEAGREASDYGNELVTDFLEHSGNGLEGRLNGKLLHAGKQDYIEKYTDIPGEALESVREAEEKGMTSVFLEEDGRLLGIVWLIDGIRPESRQAVSEMKALGICTVMLTGDRKKTAENIARDAGVDEVIAEVLPGGKEEMVRKYAADGKTAMVGDGINDAPALTAADCGIAIGAGTDVAKGSADIVLMHSSLWDVPESIRLSRAVVRNIRQNLFWALFYNVIMIPLAAGLFGLTMKPMFGAAAMSLSSITVCLNALRLNLFRFRK